jgi:hypothetical protein
MHQSFYKLLILQHTLLVLVQLLKDIAKIIKSNTIFPKYNIIEELIKFFLTIYIVF